jgi:hypothetical protein
MLFHRLLLFCALLGGACTASAERPVVTSTSADSTSVAIYRDPTRSAGDPIPFKEDDERLSGYAMITETRTVDLTPGEVLVRFEGVASGIIPQSAVLLNSDAGEKNFDRRLLSQRGLLDAFTGQRVRLYVRDDSSGKAQVEDATIVSQPDGLILKTARGYEAVKCDGRLSKILFPGLPVDLTAKPTLSMTTRPDSKGGKMTLTLAYLADNFDWRADYIGTLASDTQTLELFGWMTVASMDRTAFLQAELSAIAGDVFRTGYDWEEIDAAEEERGSDPYAAANISLKSKCWPDAPNRFRIFAVEFPERPTYCYSYCYDASNPITSITVQGARIAEQRDVADVKLYVVPFPTNIQPQSMKQIRFLNPTPIKGETLFRIDHYSNSRPEPELVFRFTNLAKNGGGMPLPAGSIRFFQTGPHGRNLIGSGHIEDKAVGEEIEIVMDESASDTVKGEEEVIASTEKWKDRVLRVKNANPYAVSAEVRFRSRSNEYSRFSKRVKKRSGAPVWRVEIAPQSQAEIRFRTTQTAEVNR